VTGFLKNLDFREKIEIFRRNLRSRSSALARENQLCIANFCVREISGARNFWGFTSVQGFFQHFSGIFSSEICWKNPRPLINFQKFAKKCDLAVAVLR